MKKLSILCIAVLIAGVAFAGPYDPDYRGDENSVHAVFINPAPGIPGLALDLIEFDIGPSNYPLDPTPPDGFFDGLRTQIILPNFIDELPLKKMRIQMEFLQPVSGAEIFVDVMGIDSLAGPVPGMIVGGSDLFIPDYFHYFDIEMYPNPDWEEIFIINQVDPVNAPTIIEIDTISIPEPGSMGMLALVCGFGLFIRRRFLV